MALERKRHTVRSGFPGHRRLVFSFTAGSGNGTLTAAGGDKSLVTSIAGTAGSYTLVLKQVGYSFLGGSVTCMSASTILSGRLLTHTTATKTITFKTDNAAGSATAPADGELVTVELIYKDTVGQ